MIRKLVYGTGALLATGFAASAAWAQEAVDSAASAVDSAASAVDSATAAVPAISATIEAGTRRCQLFGQSKMRAKDPAPRASVIPCAVPK